MDNKYKKSHVVIFNSGSYDDASSTPLAAFNDYDQAEKWVSSMKTLINYLLTDAKEREIRNKDFSGVNYDVFGIESIRNALKFSDWFIVRDNYSFEIVSIPVLG